MGLKDKNRSLGLAVLVIGVALFLASPLFFRAVIGYLETIASVDQVISPQSNIRVAVVLVGLPGLVVLIGFALRRDPPAILIGRVKNTLLLDQYSSAGPARMLPVFNLLISPVVGLLLAVFFLLYRYWPEGEIIGQFLGEDSLVEYSTALLFAASAVLAAIAAFKLRARSRVEIRYRRVVPFWILAALGTFLISMEEISWGQRLLGWETQGAFRGNLSGETNIHNFISPYFDWGYLALTAVVLVVVVISLALEWRGKMPVEVNLILPRGDMIGLALMVFVFGGLHEELLELYASLFALLYAIRLLAVSRALKSIPSSSDRGSSSGASIS